MSCPIIGYHVQRDLLYQTQHIVNGMISINRYVKITLLDPPMLWKLTQQKCYSEDPLQKNKLQYSRVLCDEDAKAVMSMNISSERRLHESFDFEQRTI